MKIDLSLVRQVLKEALGFDSFTASFITSVKEDPEHPTAKITRKGVLSYNPEFVKRYIGCKEDLFSLLFHELLHPMFGHFIYKAGKIENIAADAIINAVISTVYAAESGNGNLFKKAHSPRGLHGLMRPQSIMHHSRYAKVYNQLYGVWNVNGRMTTGELIQTLKILTQTENLSEILLIGSHEGDGTSGESLTGLSKETLARIAEDVKRSIASGKGGRQAGYNPKLMEMFLEALRIHLSIRKVLLQKFATKRKVDKFKELFQERRMAASPVPMYPSKRDLVLLAAGIWPGHFHNQIQQPKTRDRGLAIYLDVSGSVNAYLPNILGVLRSLRKEITSIFQFSNKVVETSFESLLKGSVKTTYGTDFDCIAESILERGFDKAVVITDGYASMNKGNRARLKESGLVTLTILFDNAQNCKDFESFGDVVPLEEICD